MSLELNKMAAAVLTAGVVAMSAGFVAKQLVHPTTLAENAYPIQIADAPAAGPAAPEAPSLEPVLPLLADADVAAGEAAFRACASCHTYEQGGPNRVGPNLWNIVGNNHAHIEGFNYSGAMQERHDEPWSYEALNAFLANPRQALPGTRMAYNGMRSVQDRANLIAWLRTLSDDPQPLPSEAEIQEVVGEAEEPAAEEADAAPEPAAEPEAEAAAEPEAEAAPEAGEAAAEQQAEAAPAGDDGLLGLIAAADPAQGESLSRRCAACHTFDEGGPNRVGPNLWDVLGKSVAHLEGFNFSPAAQEKHDAGVTWTYENMSAFLENPRGWMPGTRMVFPGLRSPEDRAALIAFLRTKSDSPPPLE